MHLPKPYFEDQNSGIVIYHGDCRDILPTIDSVDLLCTDPPYGLKASRKASYGSGVKRHMTGIVAGKAISKRDYGDSDWDDEPCPADLLELAFNRSSEQVVWGGNYFPLPPTKGILVWDKLRGDTDFADGEIAWTSSNRSLRILRYLWNGFLVDAGSRDERVHPTQKPLAVMKWCLSFYPEAKSVLDPFMGSGTTLRAAKDLGLVAIGIEADERYCEIAANRLRQEVLFGVGW